MSDNSLRPILNGKLQVPVRVGDYEYLKYKPMVNGVELKGDLSFEDLGELTITNSELKDIVDSQYELVFGGN